MSGTNQTVLAGSNPTSKWKEPKLTAVPPLPLLPFPSLFPFVRCSLG